MTLSTVSPATTKTKSTVFIPIDIGSWKNTATKVKKADRPENVLDRKPDEHDAKSVETLVEEFLDSSMGKLAFKNVKKLNKTVDYAALAKEEHIRLCNLLSALSVQRPISHKHLRKIVERFDEKKVQFVNVLKINVNGVYVYYIIDGQHTAVTYGAWAKKGYFSSIGITEDNWADVPVKCQVVEFDNFTFAREHFLGINGEDKLKLAMFDKWKNYVLAKRQDSPDSLTKDLYEDAHTQQMILESYGITPVHEGDVKNCKKPGAFTRVDLLKDLSDEEVHWFCQVHQLNWDDREVDASEVGPMVDLRHKLKGAKTLSDPEVKEFIVTLGNIIKNIAGSPAQFKALTESTHKEWYKTAYDGEKVPAMPPKDASLALLLQIYYEYGGKFSGVSKQFLNDFDDSGYTMFHALDQAIQDIIKP